ncbi:MAG: Galactose-1-phosphate uridylyltransferase, partial [uncultured Rubrobacteraceae bacterium]
SSSTSPAARPAPAPTSWTCSRRRRPGRCGRPSKGPAV